MSLHFRYSYSVSSTVLNIKSICETNPNDLEPFYSFWGDDFSVRALPQIFMRRFEQVVYGVDIGKRDICKNNLDAGVAVVKFQLAAQTVTQIEKKLRYSDADYISNLGMKITELNFSYQNDYYRINLLFKVVVYLFNFAIFVYSCIF